MLNQRLNVQQGIRRRQLLHKDFFFYAERDSFMANASCDGESAYMLGLFKHLFPVAGSTTMNVVHARIIIAYRLDIQTEGVSVFLFFNNCFKRTVK